MPQLETSLGYTFRDQRLLLTALTHPSFRHEQPDVEEDHQRLEFLGDAVLGLLAADFYYRTCETGDEGQLTRLRVTLASTTPLARAARAIGLGAHIRLGRGEQESGGMERDTLLADTMEALLGAAYLDGGMPAADRIFANVILPLRKDADDADSLDNPKGALQEWAQKNNLGSPVYSLLNEEGEPHQKIYTVRVFINEKVYGTGRGSSKREAEKQAAVVALQKIA